jgi:hypothetical protein
MAVADDDVDCGISPTPIEGLADRGISWFRDQRPILNFAPRGKL